MAEKKSVTELLPTTLVPATPNTVVAPLDHLSQGIDIRVDARGLVAAYETDYVDLIQANIKKALKVQKKANVHLKEVEETYSKACAEFEPEAKHIRDAEDAVTALKKFHEEAVLERFPAGASKKGVYYAIDVDHGAHDYTIRLRLVVDGDKIDLPRRRDFTQQLVKLRTAVDEAQEAVKAAGDRLKELRDLSTPERVAQNARRFEGTLAKTQLQRLSGGDAYSDRLNEVFAKINKQLGLESFDDLSDEE